MTKTAARRPRILFFDYWTKGAPKFERIVDSIGEDRAEFRLFHLGSFRDRRVPKAEIVGRLPAVDISSFGGAPLADVLGSLFPDVVVGLNVSGLFDRIMFLTCAKMGIPTVFVQHGAWVPEKTLRKVVTDQDRRVSLIDYARRAPKFAALIPKYLAAQPSIGHWPKAAKVLASAVRQPISSHFFPVEPDELWPDLSLVFSEGNADLLHSTLRLPRERIQVVGNPELDPVVHRAQHPLGPEARAALLSAIGLRPEAPVITWLEDGLVEQQNCFGWTEETRVTALRDLAALCREAGAGLLVRPHPIAHTAAMAAELRGFPEVVITRDIDLLDSLDVSVATVGTISTALETAVVLCKPILIPSWYVEGDRANAPYAELGLAHSPDTKGDLGALLRSAVEGALPPLRPEVSMARLGPLDGRAAERIAAAILESASERRRGG